MPISASYTWSETKDLLHLQIPLKGVSPKAVDIVAARTVLKVSFVPYLIDLDLAGYIDDDKSRAVFKDGVLHIHLIKELQIYWNQLLFDGEDKERKERRRISLQQRSRRIQNQVEQVKETKLKEERKTLRDQMNLEQKERKQIDDFKESEKKEAEKEIYEHFAKLNYHHNSDTALKDTHEKNKCDVDYATEKTALKEVSNSNDSQSPAAICQNTPSHREQNTKEFMKKNMVQTTTTHKSKTQHPRANIKISTNRKVTIPAPRTASKVFFNYTPRLFKTPLRESTVKKETIFIAKNRPHLKKNYLLNTDALLNMDLGMSMDIAERDATWLEHKGNNFYRDGDYYSAINAYSSAFEADDTFVQAVFHRAACYLHLQEPMRCMKDCETVLSMESAIVKQYPKDENTSKFRKNIHILIGSAHCQLDKLDLAIHSLDSASNFNTEDENDILQDIKHLRLVQNAYDVKHKADRAFQSKQLEKAESLYNEALNMSTTPLVSALSNRAACHLACGRYQNCISDCNDALDLLSKSDLSYLASSSNVAGIKINVAIPPPGTDKRRHCVLVTLCRRAAAKVICLEHEGAIDDLKIVHTLTKYTNNKMSKEIENDITNLKARLMEGIQ